MFRRLAVFPRQLQLDAAQAICGERTTLEPLLQLQRKSLIVGEHDDTDMRYRLLETVRAYAAEKLLEAGEESLVRDRHRAHFLAGWSRSPRNSPTSIPAATCARAAQPARRSSGPNSRDGWTWSGGWPA